MAKLYYALGDDILVVDTDRSAWAYKESVDELFWTWHIYDKMQLSDSHIVFTHADGSIIGFNINVPVPT